MARRDLHRAARRSAEWWRRLAPDLRRSIAGAGFVVILLVVGLQVQKQREAVPTPDPRSFPVSSASAAVELATLQLGYPVLWKDSTTRRLSFLLDVLDADCPADTSRDLAGMTRRSERRLQSRRIAATPTEILGGVEGATRIGSLADCSSFFRRYVDQRSLAGR